MDTKTKIYVAGHTGLVGSSLVPELRRRGYDNLVLRTQEELELTDPRAIKELLAAERPECVILMAAKVGGIQANINDPVGFLAENALINTNVITAALAGGVRRLLYVGSSCMYPRNYQNLLKEEHLLAAPLEPTNEGYALAKIMGAKLCEYANRQHGVWYKTLIPCNLYGPRERFDPIHSHLIAAVILKLAEAVRRGEDSVEIWGDGTARREFLFVDDLTGFMCDVLPRLEQLPDYLNVGYGRDFTVLEYYETAARVVGFKGKFTFDRSRPVGMDQKLLDSSRAAPFGWKPATTLEAGMRATFEFYLKQVQG